MGYPDPERGLVSRCLHLHLTQTVTHCAIVHRTSSGLVDFKKTDKLTNHYPQNSSITLQNYPSLWRRWLKLIPLVKYQQNGRHSIIQFPLSPTMIIGNSGRELGESCVCFFFVLSVGLECIMSEKPRLANLCKQAPICLYQSISFSGR
jgi:hypothetical protein